MAEAIVDSAVLRAFAERLDESCREVMDCAHAVARATVRAGDKWKDRKYAALLLSLEETLAVLPRFYLQAESQVRYLREKADLARRYLDGQQAVRSTPDRPVSRSTTIPVGPSEGRPRAILGVT